jgi:hypothetical protein
MAILGTMIKQPNEVLDFDIDYTTVLAGRSDTLQTSAVTISTVTGTTNNPVTATSPTINLLKVKVVVSSGTAGVTYKATVLTTTSATLKYEDEVLITVEDT